MVLVTDVPMLEPMMIGMADFTSSTVQNDLWSHLFIMFSCCDGLRNIFNSQPEDTRLTMIEVEVEELWTSTVTKIPTTKPATGLDRIAFSWKMSPATFPGRR